MASPVLAVDEMHVQGLPNRLSFCEVFFLENAACKLS